MGMYDQLNKISRNIEQNQVDIKKSQEHQKKVEYIQTELEGALLASLQNAIKYSNIFNDEIKSIAIDDVLNSEDLQLYNKDYTRQYLNKKYYTIARQVEQIHKKQNVNEDNWQKDLAFKKFEYQKEKDYFKMSLAHEKQQAKNQAELLKIKQLKFKNAFNIILLLLSLLTKMFIIFFKVGIYIFFLPFMIFGVFTFGLTSALIKVK